MIVWTSLENAYVSRLRLIFERLREETSEISSYLFKVKALMAEVLKKPTTMLNGLDAFLNAYNKFETEIRWDSEFKSEMHLRVSQLQDSMLKMVAESKSSSDAMFLKFLDDKWVEEKVYAVASLYQHLIKAEADRYCASSRLLQDYFKDNAGKVTARQKVRQI